MVTEIGVSTQPRQQWISSHTLSVIEVRRSLKISGLDSDTEQNTYRQLSREIQRLCRKDKSSYLQQMCREIEMHANANHSKEMFFKVKCLSRDFKPKSWAVKNPEGELITNLHEVIEVWRNYCENLYHEDGLHALSLDFEQEPDILLSEVEHALNKLKTNKATGIDVISAETLKCLGDDGISLLHNICKSVWSSGVWPDEWCTSIFVPLHKKGFPTNPDNYRLLSLSSHASKVLLYILQSRLEGFIGWQISQAQAGFVKGRGTREQILNLRQIIEKAREHYFPVFICFVDYSKAFDNVKWPKLWEILISIGVPYHLVFLIQQLYESNSARVRIDGNLFSQTATRKGVRQGCVLSPMLFNIYYEFVMRQVLDNWNGGVTIGGSKISNVRFADDTTLIAASQEEPVALLNILEQHREHDNYREIGSIGHCEVVQSFIYLGSLIDNSGSCENEVRRRIQQARVAMTKLTKIWRDHNITKATKMSLVQSLVFSIFLYASETWTVKKADRARIDAYEMWTWRRMLRVPYTAHRTNVSILDESRLEAFIGWQISQAQAAFVKGRGTREQILNLRQIIEKAREHYFPVFICFVDYSKAFDNQLYESSSARVRIDGNLSYSEFVMRQVLDNWNGGITIGGSKISNLRFADDTTLIAASQEELVALLNNTVQHMVLARVAMTKLTKIWRDHNITKATKMSLVQSLVFSIFLYASETWTVKKADRTRIEAFEMWTWRRILRVPYTAHRTNVSILDELDNPKRLSSIVSTRMLTFFGHIHRSDNMEKRVVQGHAPNGRRRDRSPTRWVDMTK
ncbi:unnamed protein product [Callosobruchus maculatus]|uniref:Reverse transcriptase domain-containing protein n=2 Tax=Callosobruchus maculatus TaxID=64391 RepID=A0A653CXV7_CALMS|nr:unnamed protein product [Callosobruchus maculatus]